MLVAFNALIRFPRRCHFFIYHKLHIDVYSDFCLNIHFVIVIVIYHTVYWTCWPTYTMLSNHNYIVTTMLPLPGLYDIYCIVWYKKYLCQICVYQIRNESWQMSWTIILTNAYIFGWYYSHVKGWGLEYLQRYYPKRVVKVD